MSDSQHSTLLSMTFTCLRIDIIHMKDIGTGGVIAKSDHIGQFWTTRENCAHPTKTKDRHRLFLSTNTLQILRQLSASLSNFNIQRPTFGGEKDQITINLFFFSYLWRSYSAQGGWSSAFSMLTNI